MEYLVEKQSEDIENMRESIKTMIRNVVFLRWIFLQYVTSLDELAKSAEYQTDPKYNSIVEVSTSVISLLQRQRAVLIDFRKDFNRINVACL